MCIRDSKLGLYSIKSELEDIALKYLEPKDYEPVSYTHLAVSTAACQTL